MANNIASLQVLIGVNTKKFQKGMGELQNKVESSARRIQSSFNRSSVSLRNFGRQLNRTVGLAALSFGSLAINAAKGTKEGEASINRLKGKFQELKTALVPIGNIMLKIADEWMPKIVKGAQNLSQRFQKLSPSTQQLVITLGALLPTLGPILIAFNGLRIVFAGILSPIGLLVLAIGALAAAFIYLWNNNDQFREKVLETWEIIKAKIQPAIEAISNFIKEKLDKIKMWWDEHGTEVIQAVGKIMDTISNKIQETWGSIEEITKYVWPIIQDTIELALDTILGIIEVFSKTINGDWEGALNSLLVNSGNILNDIGKLFDDILGGLPSQALQWGGNLLNSFIDGIKAGVERLKRTVSGVASTVKSFLGLASPAEKGPLSTADKWMPNLMKMMTQGIEMGVPQLKAAVLNTAATVDLLGGTGGATTNNNINVYARQQNLDERGLGRMLDRMSFLNGGSV